jgi:DNA-binding transcriptional LysR family regulator
MELRWLDDFCALARTRHFSRAADERHVSQPAFSRRIKMLEEEVGVTLVDRNSIPLCLTPAGEIFLHSCEAISQRMQITKKRCRDLQAQQQNRISFATSQSLYVSFFQHWNQHINQSSGLDAPLEVNLKSSNWIGTEFIQALQQNTCDLIMCYWHTTMQAYQDLSATDYEYLVLGQDSLQPMSAPQADQTPLFALPDSMDQSKGKSLPYIAYHQSTFLAQAVSHSLQHAAPSPSLLTVNENIHPVSARAMICEGFGLGWLPARLARDELNKGNLCLAGNAQWHIPLEIRLYRKRSNDSTALQQLWQYLAGLTP